MSHPRVCLPPQARYLLTGSTDRKSVAAVLVHLAARKLIRGPAGRMVTIAPLLAEQRLTRPPEERLPCGPKIAEVHSFFPIQPARVQKAAVFCFVQRNGTDVSLIGA